MSRWVCMGGSEAVRVDPISVGPECAADSPSLCPSSDSLAIEIDYL